MSDDFTDELMREFGAALDGLLPLADLLEAARADARNKRPARQQIFELGWPALALTEEDGGLGLGIEALAALAAVAGARLLPVAMREEAFLLAPALAAASRRGDEDAGLRLERLLTGEGSGGGSAAAGGLVLDEGGEAIRVRFDGNVVWLSPDAIDAAIVTPNAAVILPVSADGVTLEPVTALDRGQGAYFLTADTVVTAARCFGREQASAWWQRWRLIALAGLVGVSSAVLDLAIDHASAREQFGRPIAKFQAVSHMLAEMKMRTELTRSSVSLLAAMAAVGEDIDDLGTALAYAVPQLVREAIEYSIQVHGGTGYTWEYGLHLFYRRVLQTQAGFGGAIGSASGVGRDLIASRS